MAGYFFFRSSTLEWLMAAATTADKLHTLLALLVLAFGVLFSKRLWSVVTYVASALWRGVMLVRMFHRGVVVMGQMLPTLQGLPDTLKHTGEQVAELTEGLSLRVATHEQLSLQMGQLLDKVKSIDHQVQPNGGKSLHDMVRLLGDGLDSVKSNVHVVSNVLRISLDSLGNFGVFYADANGDLTYASSAYLKLVNRTERQMLRLNWINAVVEEDRERVFEEWLDCIKHNRDFDMRFRMNGVVGEVTVAVTASSVSEADGKVLLWVGAVRREPYSASFNERRGQQGEGK